MNNILFVNAFPVTRVNPIIEELKEQMLSFTATVCTSANEANRYVTEHGEEIDYVIIDPEVPYHNGRDAISPFTGLSVIDLVLKRGKPKGILITNRAVMPAGRLEDFNAKCYTAQVDSADDKVVEMLIMKS